MKRHNTKVLAQYWRKTVLGEKVYVIKVHTYGITGVYKVPNGWIAKISIDKKPREIGRFKTKREAVICRLEAEKKYYKEHLWQKHLWKEYGIVE